MDVLSPLDDAVFPDLEIMTPRTKVAKMLADIDDDFDNASTPSPMRNVPRKASYPERTASPSFTVPPKAQQEMGSPQRSVLAHHDLGRNLSPALASDDSDGSSIRPQGRAAKRMFGNGGTPASSSPFPAPPSVLGADDIDDVYRSTPIRQPNLDMVTSNSPLEQQGGNPLFVSPAKSNDDGSEDELPSNPIGGKDKLAELVAQKRAERLAREAEEKERKEAAALSSDLPDEAFEGSQDAVDPDIERIMSDATRPSRKASKKALLEMERETQRMAREQALAHQIKVKKKFTTKDLFAKFNFRPNGGHEDVSKDPAADGDTTASSAPNSDGVDERPKELHSTPPSSPPTPHPHSGTLTEQSALSKPVRLPEDNNSNLLEIDDDIELPDLAELVKAARAQRTEAAVATTEPNKDDKALRIARLVKAKATLDDGSDDELEILPKLPSHLQVFDKVAGSKGVRHSADSNAIQRLKHLSNFHANESRQQKKGSRPSVNPQALHDQLRRQAKEQARKDQLERIEELKAKGIEIQTTEDKEKEAEAMENLLEKARQDAVKLRQTEKAAKRATENEGAMEASDDEDEDEDYESGSEDESADGDAEGAPELEDGGLIDDAAEETSEGEEDDEEGESVDGESLSEDLAQPPLDAEVDQVQDGSSEEVAVQFRKSRKSRVIIDEDDDNDDVVDAAANFAEQDTELHPTNANGEDDSDDVEDDGNVRDRAVPPSPAQANDPFAAFNFGNGGNANLLYSPTQAFHATMQTSTQMTQEDSFDILRHIAPPSAISLPPAMPDFDTQDEESTQSFVQGSQVPESQRVDLHWDTQPPETPVPAGLHRNASALSETPGWEPSQDAGLPSPWTVKAKLQSSLESSADHETQSTVRLRVSESPAPSQPAQRRGRLVRKPNVSVMDSDDDDDEAHPAAAQLVREKDAFREMAKRRKQALTATERADADKEMRGMMDEQAEESDDEYAGVGGDDYVAPETEQDREMIDSSHVEVDERAIAAHFAEKQRLRDEAETSRLYKDLTTGVLRRKMGANAFDLEEDEDEMAARRRQMRQQEEARKRKALLKDINVASLAEGKQSKGKDAFLRAIADDDADEDIANLSGGEEELVPTTQDDTQTTQSLPTASGPLLETSSNKRPRMTGEEADDSEPALKQRRTQASSLRRPTSLLEVKESVSFLLEESHGAAFAGHITSEPEFNSDDDEIDNVEATESSEDEFVAAEAARANDGGFAPNPKSVEAKVIQQPRTAIFNARTNYKTGIVDRLSLKRSSSNVESAHGRTAWASGPTTGGFKVPSLLRRATTNTTSSANDRGVTTPSLSRENSEVKMGGTKKSSLAYQARAEERRAIVEASAKRREENTARIALLRRNSSALNRGLTGRVE